MYHQRKPQQALYCEVPEFKKDLVGYGQTGEAQSSKIYEDGNLFWKSTGSGPRQERSSSKCSLVCPRGTLAESRSKVKVKCMVRGVATESCIDREFEIYDFFILKI